MIIKSCSKLIYFKRWLFSISLEQVIENIQIEFANIFLYFSDYEFKRLQQQQ